MTESKRSDLERVSPSAFMRQLRPEYYSDTADRTTYQLDVPTLEYHLDTVTARNQSHDFELFCRKLCERAICPNLRPATGPEGGGDSKADTETTPVADEITKLYYQGMANSGSERWGFAFSAKSKWADKVRADVAGLVDTGRQYDKIFCVTARFARAKNRSKLEDELTRKHGVPVTIHDRTWIVKEIIEGDRKDLAFNYLKVGQEVRDGARLGPTDYSRIQQLDDLEKALGDATRFEGMELQRVTEALVAAKLSRNLEHPRIETEGRFARAIRLADAEGTQRQRLEAHYERLWTGFWWFDDIAMLNEGYDAFGALCLKTDHAVDLEFLCNLAQLIFNAVIHHHLSETEAKLEDRIARLTERLKALAAEEDRPNNALQARLSLLQIETNHAVLAQDPGRLAPVWPQISQILDQARGLGEFPADKLTRLIEVFGMVAGNDAGYARLVDQTAEFVASRKSEAEGALVLLKRAQQLDFDERFEMIRLLGKAGHQLSKKEYASSMIEATRLLALAYRSAGLLWAARASCIMAIASIFIEAEEASEVPASVVPTLMLWGWISVQLRHLPDTFESIRLTRGCVASLPLTEDSKKRAQERLENFDWVLASHLLNLSPIELAQTSLLPDVLDGLGLHHSATALLYALGHEAVLRERGLPAEMTREDLAQLYNRLASQPAPEDLEGPVIFNSPGPQAYRSVVLGIQIEVHHPGTDASSQIAEVVLGVVEALFATTLDFEALPHVERFSIAIDEVGGLSQPEYTVDAERARAAVRWPSGLLPGNFEAQEAIHDLLIGLSGTILVATCAVRNPDATFKRLFSDDGVLHRISMIIAASNSRSRLLKCGVGRLSDWSEVAENAYPVQDSRPLIERSSEQPDESQNEIESPASLGKDAEGSEAPRIGNHRNVALHSVIDLHLWDRARWSGTAFLQWGDMPGVGLLFQDGSAGQEIFERWRDRFGPDDQHDDIYLAIVRGISVAHPSHYRVMITSRPLPTGSMRRGRPVLFSARMNTLEPTTDVNLTRFLAAYQKAQRYLLMPASLGDRGQPEPLWDHAIRKQKLSVKLASEIAANDIEMMAVRQGSQ